MDKLRALQYFVSAAVEGSFVGASRRMKSPCRRSRS